MRNRSIFNMIINYTEFHEYLINFKKNLKKIFYNYTQDKRNNFSMFL